MADKTPPDVRKRVKNLPIGSRIEVLVRDTPDAAPDWKGGTIANRYSSTLMVAWEDGTPVQAITFMGFEIRDAA